MYITAVLGRAITDASLISMFPLRHAVPGRYLVSISCAGAVVSDSMPAGRVRVFLVQDLGRLV